MDGSDQLFAGPDNTALRFFERPTKNNFQSERHGRPIFDTSLIVEVMTPGSRESSPEFEVERTFCIEAGTDANGERLVERGPKYAQLVQQVEAYKAQNGNGALAGTPLSQWPNADTGTVATLKASGIHTVEQLASVQDVHLANLGIGGRVLRDQASAFLQTQQFGVPTAQMSADTTHLREQVEKLTTERDELTQRLTVALAEVNALRTGTQRPPAAPQMDEPQGGAAQTDPFGLGTQSQPNPLSAMDSNSASPLTPSEGEAKDNAKDDKPAAGNAPPPLI